MNDKQFEALLAVANKISDHLEWISLQSENIHSILVEMRVDYQNVNDLETDEEWLDGLMAAAREYKKKKEKSEEGTNIGGIE